MLRKFACSLLLLLALTSNIALPALATDTIPFPDTKYEAMDYTATGYWHDERYIADLMMTGDGLHLRFTNGTEVTVGLDVGAYDMLGAATTAMAMGLPVRTYVQDGQVIAVYARKK
jgi:hypothetical protein